MSRQCSWSGKLIYLLSAASFAAFISVSSAHATVTLSVNTVTGDLKLLGQDGDTLDSYVIYSASSADSLLYTGWNNDRFGGIPVGASLSTSIADGFGAWHPHGTVTPASGTTTYQLGEMSAIYGGYATNGVPNASTSKIFTFDATHTEIDLGDHFVPGSLEDLVFGYGTAPGFFPDWIFDGQSHSYTITTAGSWYEGQSFTADGVVSTVAYVSEPGSWAILSIPLAVIALGRRRKSNFFSR